MTAVALALKSRVSSGVVFQQHQGENTQTRLVLKPKKKIKMFKVEEY